MERPKFTFNAFVITTIVFSAILLFFTTFVFDMSDTSIINESYEIEDTGYYVRYTTHIPSGIYDSDEAIANLMIEGKFGYDWAAVHEGNFIFCNEYHSTAFGYMVSDIVRISLDDFEKKVIMKDSMLNGRCASGELICYEGVLMPNWFSSTNPLSDLYAISSLRKIGKGEAAGVTLYDAKKEEKVFTAYDERALSEERSDYYRASTLKEIEG